MLPSWARGQIRWKGGNLKARGLKRYTFLVPHTSLCMHMHMSLHTFIHMSLHMAKKVGDTAESVVEGVVEGSIEAGAMAP